MTRPALVPAPRPLAIAVQLGALLVMAGGVVAAARAAWVCDDAFISFRYAENLLAGHGLVYNAGERVEGYTNFLWTMLVAAGMAMGSDPIRVTTVLGLGFFAGHLLVLAWGGMRLARASGAPAFPLAAVGLALHWHARLFATGGLETSMFAFLVTAALLVAAFAQRTRGFLLVGVLTVLATMTRPDGAVLGAVTFGAALLHAWQRRSVRGVLAFLLPVACLWLPYFVWRWHYYGWPLPNTFYAKSASDPYLASGLLYAASYFGCYWILPLGLLGAVAMLRRHRLASLVLGFTALYAAFVVWVGGDFMFARFWIPVTPVLLLGFELSRCRFAPRWWSIAVSLALLLGLELIAYPPELERAWSEASAGQSARARLHGLSEEPTVYPAAFVEHSRLLGERFREATAGLDPRIVIYGSQAMLAYWSKCPLVIEGSTGLTDEYLAHRRIEHRGRIAHEKQASSAYLLERHIDFVLAPRASFGYEDALGTLRDIDFGQGLRGTILVYRRALMDPLHARSGVTFTPFEGWLDDYIARLQQGSTKDLHTMWPLLKLFYFDHNADPERERVLLQRL